MVQPAGERLVAGVIASVVESSPVISTCQGHSVDCAVSHRRWRLTDLLARVVLTEGEEVPGAANGGADVEEVPVAAVEARAGARARVQV